MERMDEIQQGEILYVLESLRVEISVHFGQGGWIFFYFPVQATFP
jgi:hypothetical protein